VIFDVVVFPLAAFVLFRDLRNKNAWRNHVKKVSATLWFCLQRRCKTFCLLSTCVVQTVCVCTMDFVSDDKLNSFIHMDHASAT